MKQQATFTTNCTYQSAYNFKLKEWNPFLVTEQGDPHTFPQEPVLKGRWYLVSHQNQGSLFDNHYFRYQIRMMGVTKFISQYNSAIVFLPEECVTAMRFNCDMVSEFPFHYQETLARIFDRATSDLEKYRELLDEKADQVLLAA